MSAKPKILIDGLQNKVENVSQKVRGGGRNQRQEIPEESKELGGSVHGTEGCEFLNRQGPLNGQCGR